MSSDWNTNTEGYLSPRVKSLLLITPDDVLRARNVDVGCVKKGVLDMGVVGKLINHVG